MTMNKKWYATALAQNDTSIAEIEIYDGIGYWETSAEQFINDVKSLGDVSQINLNLNCPGGEVWDGMAIYTYLTAHKATINVRVDGLAASMGSVIMLAGDNISIAEGAFVMIHNPSACAWGESKDLEKSINMLKKIEESMANIYSKKTGKDIEEIKEIMDAETWFTAQDAVDFGLADNVFEGIKAAASYDLKGLGYKKVPSMLNTGITGDMEGNKMPESKAPETPVIDKAYLEANCQAILKEIKAEAYAEGVSAECDRIKSLEELSAKGYEDVLMECKFDGKTTQAEAAVMMVKAFKDKGDTYLESMKADAKESDEIEESSIVDEVKSDDPIACWESDSKLRAEFGDDKDAYMAYKKATDNGLVKIRGDK